MQNPGGEGMRVRYADGTFRTLSEEEIAEIEALAQDEPLPPPTEEERIDALESAMLELMGVTPNG